MLDTSKDSALTAVYADTLLDDLDAMSATSASSFCDDRDLPRWPTQRGWCEAMGISSAVQEVICDPPIELAER